MPDTTDRLLNPERGTMLLLDLPPNATAALLATLLQSDPATLRIMVEVEPSATLNGDVVPGMLKLSPDHKTWSPPLAHVLVRSATLYDAP